VEVKHGEMKTVIPKIDEESGVAWLTLNRPEKKTP
jgi:enoyl-CoA hydratase/carnithine racemase